MRPKEFQRLLDRDSYCLHCGETEALSPNHRINRGMGGSKQRDTPSNYVLLCSRLNGLIESDSGYAEMARRHGWKLSSWQDPRQEPVLDCITGTSWILGDDWSRSAERETHATNTRASQF